MLTPLMPKARDAAAQSGVTRIIDPNPNHAALRTASEASEAPAA